MKTIILPKRESWDELCRRPVTDTSEFESDVRKILITVKSAGDSALRDYSEKFDRVRITDMKVNGTEIEEAERTASPELKKAISIAKENIEKFHLAQRGDDLFVETMPGIKCRRKSFPIEKVGLYVPGGTAPLFSTVLMLGIPAKIAGCSKIVICSPPDKE